MKNEVKEKKMEEWKNRIMAAMRECTDSQGLFNVTEFRNKYRKEFYKLPTCFGTIDNALAAIGAKKMTDQKNNPTLLLRLALDYLNLLTSKGVSVAAVARKYDVSRANVNQLFHRMKKVAEMNKVAEG